jgi:hypothetical protein
MEKIAIKQPVDKKPSEQKEEKLDPMDGQSINY